MKNQKAILPSRKKLASPKMEMVLQLLPLRRAPHFLKFFHYSSLRLFSFLYFPHFNIHLIFYSSQ
ncbi:unnamed protein product [Hymenolepis diminuta]|uniref:Uncharacterized protein n=1 Tax=Hymenolepis diminuta TaxID=6216 RepID=A0A564YH03_HYMDI|nr:unnamed protein product [Hymenolepis diminuta]